MKLSNAFHRRPPWFALVTVGVLLLGTSLVIPEHARTEADQSPAKAAGPQKGEQRQELRAAHKRVQKLRQEIGQIQQTALKNNPELQKKKKEMRSLILDTMKEDGYTPEADLSRMRELRSKMSKGGKDLPKGERKKLLQEFRKKSQRLMEAQQKALKKEKVQKARDNFRDDLLAAMKEEDPKTEELLKDLKKAQKEFNGLLSSRPNNTGQGPSSGGQ